MKDILDLTQQQTNTATANKQHKMKDQDLYNTEGMGIADKLATEFLQKIEQATGREVYMVEWQATDQPIIYFSDEECRYTTKCVNSTCQDDMTEEELEQQAQEELYRDEWSQYMEGKPPLCDY